MKSRSSGRNI